MPQRQDNLPQGISIGRRDGQDPVELTIRAADADQLAWRIHDLIPLIQTGELSRLVSQLAEKSLPNPRP